MREVKGIFAAIVRIKDKLKDGTVLVSFLNKKNAEFTIDFIANNTSLSKQWVASVSWCTPKIKIDNVLK